MNFAKSNVYILFWYSGGESLGCPRYFTLHQYVPQWDKEL